MDKFKIILLVFLIANLIGLTSTQVKKYIYFLKKEGNLYNFFIIILFQPAVTNGLIHSYPFRDSVENIVEPSSPATNFGVSFKEDRHGNKRGAANGNGGMSYFELPPSTMAGLTDLTITMWIKIDVYNTFFPCFY